MVRTFCHGATWCMYTKVLSTAAQPFMTKSSTQSLEEMEKQGKDILYLEEHQGSSKVDPSAESTGATRRELQVVNRWMTTSRTI